MLHFLSITALAALASPALLQEPAHKMSPAAPAPVAYAAQTTCPVAGNPVDKQHFADYEGQRTYFCCPKCIAKFAEFPDGFLYQMQQQGVAPENVQKTCPVSGEPLEDRENFLQVMNKRIYTCCGGCLKKLKKNPAAYLDKLEGRSAQTLCPIGKEEVDKEVFSLVQGQKIYYCCPGCDGGFKKDPDKYFAQWHKDKVVTEPAAQVCVISGEPADGSLFMTWMGRRVLFCCPKCVSVFVKDPKKHVTAL